MASFSKKIESSNTVKRTYTFRIVGNKEKMRKLHSAMAAMQRIADTVREVAQPILQASENAAQKIYQLSKDLYATVRLAEPEMHSKTTQQLVQKTLPSLDTADIKKFLRAKTSRGVMLLDKQSINLLKTDNRWEYWLRLPIGKTGKRIEYTNYALAGEYPTQQLQRPEVVSIDQITIYRRLRKDCLCIFASVTVTELVPAFEEGPVAGLDMNLDRMVLNDGTHFKMARYHDSKRHLRQRMKQPNGPQLEKQLKKRESDYGKGFVRRLASRIAKKLYADGVKILAVENLSKLTKDIKKAWTAKQKERNARLKSSFPFAALRIALTAACRRLGIDVKAINPAYTSQCCSRCGYVSSDNRTTQSRFACVKCGHTANADVNAATNIRQRIVDPEGLRFQVPESVKPGAARLELGVSDA